MGEEGGLGGAITPLEGVTTVTGLTAEESSGCGFVFFLPIVALLSGTVASGVFCVLPGHCAIGMNGSFGVGNKGGEMSEFHSIVVY